MTNKRWKKKKTENNQCDSFSLLLYMRIKMESVGAVIPFFLFFVVPRH
jgi:hypothetical protein